MIRLAIVGEDELFAMSPHLLVTWSVAMRGKLVVRAGRIKAINALPVKRNSILHRR